MSEGDRKTVDIRADDAYGQHRKDLVVQVPRSQIPAGVELQVGGVLQVRSQKGLTTDVFVLEFDEESVTLDGNHPLAGEDLVFKIELLEIL
jgi:peptidylprolyl isomerase